MKKYRRGEMLTCNMYFYYTFLKYRIRAGKNHEDIDIFSQQESIFNSYGFH